MDSAAYQGRCLSDILPSAAPALTAPSLSACLSVCPSFSIFLSSSSPLNFLWLFTLVIL